MRQMEWPVWHMLCHLNFIVLSKYLRVAGGAATVAVAKAHVMNHVGRCYTMVENGIVTIAKVGVILN